MKKNPAPRRLYWLHPHFYNWMGGHKFIYEVIVRLRQQHHLDVILVTNGLTASAQRRFQQAGVPIITTLPWSTNNPLYWLLLPLMLWFEKWYLLTVKKIDPHAGFISSMFPANRLALSVSPRAVQLCYEPFAFFYDQTFLAGFPLGYRLFAHFTKVCYQGWDRASVQTQRAIMTISQFNRRWISQAYGVDSTVVYEGVDTAFFKPTSSAQLTQKYAGRQFIFHSTDYTPIKGTTFLIQALPGILAARPQTKLVISETMPDSPMKKDVLDLASRLKVRQAIEFAGFLPYEELPAYLSHAAVVIQPSINQSMNLTIKEAMACETAVITSLEGNEQTADGEAGFLVDPHDTGTLVKRALECLTSAPRRQRLGKRGRQIILATFSWDSVTSKIYRVLTKHLYG